MISSNIIYLRRWRTTKLVPVPTAYLTLTTEHNLNRNIINEIIIARPYSVYISALFKDFLSRTKSENIINYLKKI